MKPELILFDYGNTLVTEPDWNPEKGNAALFKKIGKENEYPALKKFMERERDELMVQVKILRSLNKEMAGADFSRMLFSKLCIETPLTDFEIGETFWHAASEGKAVEGADETLGYFHSKGINTGIVSNMMWSAPLLKKRLKRIFPCREFDPILTSADCNCRKPEPYIFNCAAELSGVEKSKIVFCGDNPEADIEGAANAVFMPVYFKNSFDSRGYGSDKKPQCEYKEIHCLKELTELIL